MNRLTPIQLLAIGFLLLSVFGGLLLSLPVCAADGTPTPFLDALFTSVSAVTTTGLIVVDTGSHYNLTGQSLILLLFQIGGLGYMLFFVFLAWLLGRKLRLRNTLMLGESLKRPGHVGMGLFARRIIWFALLVEVLGALCIAFFLLPDHDPSHALFSGVFHSVSAFNTAGFSLYSDSLSAYADHVPLLTVVTAVCFAGSLGFWVVFDTATVLWSRLRRRKHPRLSTHSKLVYATGGTLLMLGMLLIFSTADWAPDLPLRTRFLGSAFQVISTLTTTGFNSIPIGDLNQASLFLMVGLMLIGAGSGSTAGGIKLSTFGVLIAMLASILRQRKDCELFRRVIPTDIVRHAVTIFFLAVLWAFIATLTLSVTEQADFLPVLFEVLSALGTVGLSTGITDQLSDTGKWMILLTMFIGRIGPLGIGMALFTPATSPAYRYPEDEVFIG